MTLTMTQSALPSSSPVAEINLQHIANNWKQLCRLSGSADTGAVVKANAYGLGAQHVARHLYEEGCRTFFTAHIDEAIEIRKTVGTLALIFLFHGVQPDNIEAVIDNDIVPVLNSVEQVALWIKHQAPVPAAIHVDTGMNRLGLQLKDLKHVQNSFPANRIGWVMSHLACADTPDHHMNRRQLEVFKKVAAIWPNAEKSLSNTAGICLGADYAFDLTRPGIGLYGGYAKPGVFEPDNCVTITAPILDIFEPEATQDATIGYGATYPVKPNQRLATIALGYADGALRALSNVGQVFLKDIACPIVGRVSMDLITVDITNASSRTSILDRVEFLGQHAHIDRQALAARTASYELLTSMGERIKRMYHPIDGAGQE